MPTPDPWSELGHAIAHERAEHDRCLTRRLANSTLLTLDVVLGARENARPLLHALTELLAGTTPDDWERASSADGANDLLLWDVWKTLDDTWHWADMEGEGELRAQLFATQLREDLELLRTRILEHLDALDDVRAVLRSLDPLGYWPIVCIGGCRGLHAEAIAAIEERTGWSKGDMLQPEAIDDEACFQLSDEAYSIEELASVMAERIAWSRALYALGDHLRFDEPEA